MNMNTKWIIFKPHLFFLLEKGASTVVAYRPPSSRKSGPGLNTHTKWQLSHTHQLKFSRKPKPNVQFPKVWWKGKQNEKARLVKKHVKYLQFLLMQFSQKQEKFQKKIRLTSMKFIPDQSYKLYFNLVEKNTVCLKIFHRRKKLYLAKLFWLTSKKMSKIFI